MFKRIWLYIGLAEALCVGVACASPAPTPIATLVPTATFTPLPTATLTPIPTTTLTPVPTATPTLTPTPTYTPSPTPLPTADLVLSEDFSDQSSWWCQRISGAVDMHCQDGELHMVSGGESGWLASREGYRDFVMQVQARFIGNAGWYSLEFRAGPGSNPPRYIFSVNPQGQYGLTQIIRGGYIGSLNIKKGEATNTLRVVAQGSRITLFANDQLLIGSPDTSFPEGRVGLGVSEGTHAAFDNLKIWVPLTTPAP